MPGDTEILREALKDAKDALGEQVAFYAMTLTLRRRFMDPAEVADTEFRRNRAREAAARITAILSLQDGAQP